MDESAAFEALLYRSIGLDAASVGPTTIARAVTSRMAARGMEDERAYLDAVRASAAELQELVEAVVIPETWFFRDRNAFEALADAALAAARPDKVLRLLSLPCSTGEEPYSMAMTLLDAGLAPQRFAIDAVDISARALAFAERGLYGKNSFRGTDLGFRDRWFVPAGNSWRIDERVRARVRFSQGNLFDPALLPGVGLYDVVFCRNVLIYFDGAGRDTALDLFTRVLEPQGLLFVGPSEPGVLLGRPYSSLRIPAAFGFRKGEATLTPAPVPAPQPESRLRLRPVSSAPAAPARRAFSRPVARPADPAPRTRAGLDAIRRLADEGRLAEAAAACEAHLREGPPSAEAMHLMGVIRDASGDAAKAADCWRKTLYLDPNHQDALTHLALLLERQGDARGARLMAERARRVNRAGKA